MSIQDDIRAHAATLLSSGEVACVVGWTKGREGAQRPIFVARTEQEAGQIVFDELCMGISAKFALQQLRYARVSEGSKRVAVLARGCETRALNRFFADRQAQREEFVVLGIPCPGMKGEDGQPLKRCEECQNRNPLFADRTFGEAVEETKPYRFAEVDRIEAMSRAERREYFDRAFSTCIRCNACREACPCCTCVECFTDQEKPGWQGGQFTVAEARFYGLTRAFHTGDRCIECGECERVCSMGLPLMSLMHKQVRDISLLFGPYDGGGYTDSGPDPLRTYLTNDIEEFM